MNTNREVVLAACAQPRNVRWGARTHRRIYMTDDNGQILDVTDTVFALRDAGLVVQDGDAFTITYPERKDFGLTA